MAPHGTDGLGDRGCRERALLHGRPYCGVIALDQHSPQCPSQVEQPKVLMIERQRLPTEARPDHQQRVLLDSLSDLPFHGCRLLCGVREHFHEDADHVRLQFIGRAQPHFLRQHGQQLVMLLVRQYRPRRISGGVQPLEPGFPFNQAAHELVKIVLWIRSEPVQQSRQVVVSRDIDKSSGQYGARQHGMFAAEPFRGCIEQRVRRTHVSSARVLHECIAVPAIQRHAAERGVPSGSDSVEQPALGSETMIVEVRLASRHEKRAGGSETRDQMAECGNGLAGRRLHDHLLETVERRYEHTEAHQLEKRLVIQELKAQSVHERRNDDVIEPEKRPPPRWNRDEQPVRSPGLVCFRLLDGQEIDQRRLSFACIRRQVDDRRRTGCSATEHLDQVSRPRPPLRNPRPRTPVDRGNVRTA